MTSGTQVLQAFCLIFGLLFCDHSLQVSFHTRRSGTQYQPAWNGPLHLLPLELEPAELKYIKIPPSDLANCEAHLIFSLCFGCLWLVLAKLDKSQVKQYSTCCFPFLHGSLLYLLRLESPQSSTCTGIK